MHEVAFRNNSNFIAPFLIIDQPSRPYWGDPKKPKKEIDDGDEFKITKAFELLNLFISERIKQDGHFQMIVFEHVPPSIFEGLECVHLVELFDNGNALIPDLFLDDM